MMIAPAIAEYPAGHHERPLMGRDSEVIVFLDVEDHIMFKMYLGRDAQRNLKQDQLEKFRMLARRLNAV